MRDGHCCGFAFLFWCIRCWCRQFKMMLPKFSAATHGLDCVQTFVPKICHIDADIVWAGVVPHRVAQHDCGFISKQKESSCRRAIRLKNWFQKWFNLEKSNYNAIIMKLKSKMKSMFFWAFASLRKIIFLRTKWNKIDFPLLGRGHTIVCVY